MKSIITPILISVLTLGFWACGNAPAEDTPTPTENPVENTPSEAADTPPQVGRMSDDGTEMIYNASEDAAIHDMVKEKFLPELKQYSRKDIHEGDGPDKIEIIPVLFQPNDATDNYIYAQVIFYKGDRTEDDFVLFYPDEDGELSADNYLHIGEDERPCEGCEFGGIRRPTGKDPYGLFINRKTTAITEYDMHYNLAEGLIQWIERGLMSQ